MKRTFLQAILMLAITIGAVAQEYKVNKSSGKLVIKDVNDVTIEGHNGNEIIFSSLDGPREKDKRAEGLRVLNSLGLEDNTGFGLSVQDKGNVIEVQQLKKMDGSPVKILVPKGVGVSLSHTTPYGNQVKIRNVENEIEVSTLHPGVKLDNVTGPLTIKTVHGEIEATLSASVRNPVSLISVHGLIDITIPAGLKANVNLSTNYGEIFVDPAIKIEMDEKSDWVKYGSNKVNGKINGGGIDLTLSSAHSSIYLRKK
jgi:hypothetical protein